MFMAAGQRPDSRQESVDQMEIAGDRHAHGFAQCLQIGVCLALLDSGLTAPRVLPVRVSFIAAGMVVIFLRIELFAA